MEFDRKAIKARGKAQFQERYWPMVGFTAIYTAISGTIGGFSGFFSELGSLPGALAQRPGLIFTGIFFGSILTAALSILGLGPLQCAMDWLYYKRYIGEEVKILDVFATFREKSLWVKTMLTMLLVSIFTFLWSLLFFVPGIIKGLSYSMAPYIIMEDPDLSPREAMDKSQEMTNGYKGKIFVMGLSFIGWELIALLSFGVAGVLWVAPYVNTSMAGVYDVLKSAQEGQVVVESVTTTEI